MKLYSSRRSVKYISAFVGTLLGIDYVYGKSSSVNSEDNVAGNIQEISQLNKCIQFSTELIKRLKLEQRIPGISIAVGVDGHLMWSQGSGYIDIENLVPCKPTSVFRIASISKSITATLFARLWDQGFLHIDDPVHKHVPDWPKKYIKGFPANVTFRHILSHTSGIRHRKTPGNGTEIVYTKYSSISEVLDTFKQDDLLFPPGTQFSYSNPAFALLAAACEKVTSKSFSELLKELFFDLGLNNTYLDESSPIIPNRTRYYSCAENGRTLVNSPFSEATHKFSSSGILSTVLDLVKFGEAMVDSITGGTLGYIKAETLKEMWSPVELCADVCARTCACLGWFISRRDEGTVFVYHCGNTLGGSSVLLILPNLDERRRVVVAIAANMGAVGQLRTVAEKIALKFAKLPKNLEN